ncbi:PREDICTED: tripartite motif-containing protein LOC642612-like [Chrysochloris asiatica]|uniref:Tripartite motif-containing protein LOC642612-like n=1 Tax=Chrysochloris asiatica TaxID=185453 RepID=A0A9B0T9Q5_CHRAS|nr:PREDICTED: tripartite motif-containing protein LOC642612-like [Chrysochloris asiatica]
MAALGLIDFKEELMCSTCLRYLTKPVAIECGHKFCFECLLKNWKEASGQGTCHQCKDVYKLRDPRYSLQLGMMAELVKPLIPHLMDLKNSLCKIHENKAEHFCVVDQVPLCDICFQSPEHQFHVEFTIEETNKTFKNEVQEILNFLHKALEFHKRELLSSEEKNEQVPCNSLQRCQSRINFPKTILKGLNMKQGWLEWMRGFSENITLDGKTASPYLTVSLDLKSVINKGIKQDVVDHQERFDYPAVMGTQNFTSGIHYWEVTVGENNEWEIGICKASMGRKNASFSNKDLFLLKCVSHAQSYILCNPNSLVLVPYSKLTTKNVGILLDYDLGTLLFYDAIRDCPLLCLPVLPSGPLCPIFFPCPHTENGDPVPLTICPVKTRLRKKTSSSPS